MYSFQRRSCKEWFSFPKELLCKQTECQSGIPFEELLLVHESQSLASRYRIAQFVLLVVSAAEKFAILGKLQAHLEAMAALLMLLLLPAEPAAGLSLRLVLMIFAASRVLCALLSVFSSVLSVRYT